MGHALPKKEFTPTSEEQKFKVSEYKFISLEGLPGLDTSIKVSDYKIQSLDGQLKEDKKKMSPVIREERVRARDRQFEISPIVQSHRGIKDQAERDFQRLVDQAVKEKLEIVRQDAFEEGLQRGMDQGRTEAREEVLEEGKAVIEKISNVLESLGHQEAEILKNQKLEIYKLLHTLTRWIILRELKEDGDYINRLLEKIILELDCRSNLIFRLSENLFSEFPQIKEELETRVGALSNTRVEIDSSLTDIGAIVESERGILDGTLDAQFEVIDKLFEKVTGHGAE